MHPGHQLSGGREGRTADREVDRQRSKIELATESSVHYIDSTSATKVAF